MFYGDGRSMLHKKQPADWCHISSSTVSRRHVLNPHMLICADVLVSKCQHIRPMSSLSRTLMCSNSSITNGHFQCSFLVPMRQCDGSPAITMWDTVLPSRCASCHSFNEWLDVILLIVLSLYCTSTRSVYSPLMHGNCVAHTWSYVLQTPVGNGSDVTISHVWITAHHQRVT